MRFVVALVIFGCSQPAKPIDPPKGEPEPPPPPVVQPQRPPTATFATSPSPMTIAVTLGAIVWTDAVGSIWTMPATGGTPKQLSDQRSPDFAFKVVAAGGAVLAASRKDFLLVDVAAGTVVKANVKGIVEYPEEIVADEAFVYFTMFKKSQIMRLPVAGGSAQQVGELARGVLAEHGDMLYAVSYTTGALVTFPKAGGKARTIAKGLVRPTALAADATHAFVYSEKDQTIQRIDLASGAANVIAKDLVNSDDLVSDGAWLYTRTWGKGNRGALVRIAKDGSRQTNLDQDLAAPYNIAFDADAIYVTARDEAQIVRFEKAALGDTD